MEDGTILLVGATTENPSFELNAAVLSRSQVLVLERLDHADLELLAQRAEQELECQLPLDQPAREALLEMADGDGRTLLNLIEQVAAWETDTKFDKATLSTRLMRRAAQYDKSGDSHYNLISACINRCAALTRMRRFIGSRVCLRAAKIHVSWRAASHAWRLKISGCRSAGPRCVSAELGNL